MTDSESRKPARIQGCDVVTDSAGESGSAEQLALHRLVERTAPDFKPKFRHLDAEDCAALGSRGVRVVDVSEEVAAAAEAQAKADDAAGGGPFAKRDVWPEEQRP